MSKIASLFIAFMLGVIITFSICILIFSPNTELSPEFELRLQEYQLQKWNTYFEYCQDIFEYEKYDLENIRIYKEKLDKCMYEKTKQGLNEF